MGQNRVNRQTPHRYKSKVKLTPTERVQESEIKHLTKQVSRLRKELVKTQTLQTEVEDAEPSQTVPVVDNSGCPKCGSPLKEVNLGFKIYAVCNNCQFRESV